MADLGKIVLGWFYYGFYYLVGGVFVTVALDRIVKRRFMIPLIVNAVAILIYLLMLKMNWLAPENRGYVLYFNYMPSVVGSLLATLGLSLWRKKDAHKEID